MPGRTAQLLGVGRSPRCAAQLSGRRCPDARRSLSAQDAALRCTAQPAEQLRSGAEGCGGARRAAGWHAGCGVTWRVARRHAGCGVRGELRGGVEGCGGARRAAGWHAGCGVTWRVARRHAGCGVARRAAGWHAGRRWHAGCGVAHGLRGEAEGCGAARRARTAPTSPRGAPLPVAGGGPVGGPRRAARAGGRGGGGGGGGGREPPPGPVAAPQARGRAGPLRAHLAPEWAVRAGVGGGGRAVRGVALRGVAPRRRYGHRP